MKRMKRRRWPVAKIKELITAKERLGITLKKVCQKYDLSYPHYYKLKRRLIGRNI